VRPLLIFALGLASAGLGVALGAWGWLQFVRSRRKSPAELERQRRLEINHHGRIAVGHILNVVEPTGGKQEPQLVVYTYEVAGVTYEAAQDISFLPAAQRFSHSLVGQTASVKYDPKKPANSVIVCEGWSGLAGVEPSGIPANPTPQATAKP